MTEKSELVEEFEEIFKTAKAEINKELDVAKSALRRAQELSDKFGVPFETTITFTNNYYFPQSFMDGRFNDDDVKQFLSDEGIEGGDYGLFEGWQTSYC